MITTPLNKILFFDIETAPVCDNYSELDPELKFLWEKKMKSTHGDKCDCESLWTKQASFKAEFARVVAISYGIFVKEDEVEKFKVKSMCQSDESHILKNFFAVIDHYSKNGLVMGGHNIKEFDVPFLCRRYVMSGLIIPSAILWVDKKPWEITAVDTMEKWRFGSFKADLISLDLLAKKFDLPSPKTVVDGSQVKDLFFAEKYEEIGRYCAGDVVTVARVVQKMVCKEPIKDEDIIYA